MKIMPAEWFRQTNTGAAALLKECGGVFRVWIIRPLSAAASATAAAVAAAIVIRTASAAENQEYEYDYPDAIISTTIEH